VESEDKVGTHIIVSMIFAAYMFIMVFEPHKLLVEVFRKDED